MYDKNFKSRRPSEKIAELFVRVEEQINTRKALSKGNVCTLEKCVEQKYSCGPYKCNEISDELQSKKD